MKKCNYIILILLAIFSHLKADEMFSFLDLTIRNDEGMEEPVRFQADELIDLAKHVVENCDRESIQIPEYTKYPALLRNSVDNLVDRFVYAYEKQFAIDKLELIDLTNCDVVERPLWEILRLFYLGDMRRAINCQTPYSQLMDIIKKKGKSPLIENSVIDEWILPPNISGLSNLKRWKYLADYLAKNYESIAVHGIWLNIGNRLLLLKNLPGERQHFYVSDHGNIDQIIRNTKSLCLSFDQEGRSATKYAFDFYKYFEKLEAQEKEFLKKHFVILKHYANKRECNELLYILSTPKSCRDALIRGENPMNWETCIGLKDRYSDPWIEEPSQKDLCEIPKDKYKEYEAEFDATLENLRYIGSIQTKHFVHCLFEENLSPFFTQIDQIFHPEDAKKCKIILIFREIAQSIGAGSPEELFRPIFSFGSRDEGESYGSFAKAFEHYFFLPDHKSEREVATLFRSILRGDSLNDERLNFLPNLAVAWFISEVSRNPLTLITNLMLLDMIENEVKFHDIAGNNWYCWRNALAHPLKDLNQEQDFKIKNAYGKDIKIDDFGGCHPMVHHGSIPQSKVLSIPLNPVRQKEGHLLIHWLALRINKCSQEAKDRYGIISASGSSTSQLGRPSSLNDIREEIEHKQKQRKKLEGTIRCKQKKDQNADTSKESLKIESLDLEIKKITQKENIKTRVLEKLLTIRVNTVNCLSL